jgi:hypothetical protein
MAEPRCVRSLSSTLENIARMQHRAAASVRLATARMTAFHTQTGGRALAAATGSLHPWPTCSAGTERQILSTAPAGSARLACSPGVPEAAATESPIPGVRCNARGDDFCGARHGQFGLERPVANNAISGQRDPV